jgi:hypothetical protein
MTNFIMKIKLIIFLILISYPIFSQEKETVVIKKTDFSLYRGVLAETKSWYLLIDSENNYYLANIEKSNTEVYDWFVRFKDSQNIFKSSYLAIDNSSKIGSNQFPTLHFKKENEPSEILSFYIEKPFKDSIILISISDNTVFKFQLEE